MPAERLRRSERAALAEDLDGIMADHLVAVARAAQRAADDSDPARLRAAVASVGRATHVTLGHLGQAVSLLRARPDEDTPRGDSLRTHIEQAEFSRTGHGHPLEIEASAMAGYPVSSAALGGIVAAAAAQAIAVAPAGTPCHLAVEAPDSAVSGFALRDLSRGDRRRGPIPGHEPARAGTAGDVVPVK